MKKKFKVIIGGIAIAALMTSCLASKKCPAYSSIKVQQIENKA